MAAGDWLNGTRNDGAAINARNARLVAMLKAILTESDKSHRLVNFEHFEKQFLA